MQVNLIIATSALFVEVGTGKCRRKCVHCCKISISGKNLVTAGICNKVVHTDKSGYFVYLLITNLTGVTGISEGGIEGGYYRSRVNGIAIYLHGISQRPRAGVNNLHISPVSYPMRKFCQVVATGIAIYHRVAWWHQNHRRFCIAGVEYCRSADTQVAVIGSAEYNRKRHRTPRGKRNRCVIGDRFYS